jgi:hypothetical protein
MTMDDKNTSINNAEFKAFGLGFRGPAKPYANTTSGGRHLYKSGIWDDNSVVQADLGETVWITVENNNVLGTHIIISSNKDGSQALVLPPFGSYTFKFSVLMEEPVRWYFTISSFSDVFSVRYTIESNLVP